MKKEEFVKAYAENANVTKKDAAELTDAFLKTVEQGLKEDGVVQLTGFGSFSVKEVAAREGHNPKNPSEKIQIPARNQVSFSSGAVLKRSINE